MSNKLKPSEVALLIYSLHYISFPSQLGADSGLKKQRYWYKDLPRGLGDLKKSEKVNKLVKKLSTRDLLVDFNDYKQVKDIFEALGYTDLNIEKSMGKSKYFVSNLCRLIFPNGNKEYYGLCLRLQAIILSRTTRDVDLIINRIIEIHQKRKLNYRTVLSYIDCLLSEIYNSYKEKLFSESLYEPKYLLAVGELVTKSIRDKKISEHLTEEELESLEELIKIFRRKLYKPLYEKKGLTYIETYPLNFNYFWNKLNRLKRRRLRSRRKINH